jgi:hypothetical protein
MAARAGDLRAFGLHIVAKRTPEEPGHAELEPGDLDLTDKTVCRRLIRLFALLPSSTPDTREGA